MKYVKQVFDCLSNGNFISSDSTNGDGRRIFVDLDERKEEYAEYYARLGFILEEGNGYFYFSRKEKSNAIIEKLKRLGKWIDILDFLKAWEPSIGPGFNFHQSVLTLKMSSDIELKEKASCLFEDKKTNDDICKELLHRLNTRGFAEVVDEVKGIWQITSAFRYLEEMVETISINENDEIS